MLPAQVHKVDPQKTITFPVPGATAAYSLDATFAEATADNGVVSITGNQSGTTHVMVVTPSGVQTFEVLVTVLPPVYPPGFVLPVNGPELAESGYYEGRYYSSPAEIQNQIDFLKINGDDRTHVHLVETTFLGQLESPEARIALSSASYQIVTARRDITLLDQYIDESQLTINGSIVRGFHMREDNWFVHAGYTSVATFEGLFLPTQPELIVGGGYRQPLTANSSITGAFYQIQVPASDVAGRSGSIGDFKYKYIPRETFWFSVDLGISHGSFGAAGRLHYVSPRDTLTALIRYMPEQFASLGANSFRGLHTDASWTRHVTKRIEAGLTFYNNNVELPGLKETTISGALSLRYQLTKHWSLTSGGNASSFQIKSPESPAIRNLTIPAGLAFDSSHFGATGQYQFAVTPGTDSGSQQIRGSARTGWRAFTFSGYAERDTNAPTLSFIFGQVSGLQLALEQQGIQATTIQQVNELLTSDAFLIAAGYVKGATINLVPVRTQFGGTANWSSAGVHRKELSYSFLFNDDQALLGNTQSIINTLSYTESVTRGDKLSLACSVMGVGTPGRTLQYTPTCFVAWRHQFKHVPEYIIPERHGTIAGNVFRDDQSKGTFEPGMPPMAEVEILLDDRRRVLTRIDGSYRFTNVPRGKHRIAAQYSSREPFFYTTPSDLEVEENATVDFGIGYSLSGLMGHVLNDAGQGVDGVSVAIRSRGLKRSAVTEADGSFFLSGLVAGDYEVQADEDTLPAGYSGDSLVDPQTVTVGASSPGKAAFTVRAFRSISGRVLGYDTVASQYVPVNNAPVFLKEPGLTVSTDLLGRYLFRDLAAGSYTLSVPNEPQTAAHTVRLGAPPVDLINVDFQISKPAPAADTVAPAVLPAGSPAVLAVEPRVDRRPLDLIHATLPTVLRPAKPPTSAEDLDRLGRQLTKAGQYREAIAELTEAIRVAPDFARAYNARGYALALLRDWAAAIADLDQAIRLNPSYENAFALRSMARKAVGDALGAAADLKRSQQLAH
jgi:hypothetical protein